MIVDSSPEFLLTLSHYGEEGEGTLVGGMVAEQDSCSIERKDKGGDLV